MKTTKLKFGLAVAIGLTALSSCNKKSNPAPGNNSENTSQISQNETNAKSSSGFNVIALRRAAGNISQINTGYSIVTPGLGVFQNVTIGLTNVTNVSGITSIINNTSALFGVTNNLSNFPGRLLKINPVTMAAGVVGPTQIGSTSGPVIFLQDIERSKDGRFYYAIRVGTRDVYVSIPGVPGNPPLIWNLAGSLPASLGATTPLIGLDIYGDRLTVYGHGQVGGSPYPNTGTNIGYYSLFTITAGGGLSFVGGAGTNISYSPAANEDAALLISDDGSINGTFVILPTPTNSFSHFYNINTNLPYWLINATASFSGALPTTQNGLLDYTYYF